MSSDLYKIWEVEGDTGKAGYAKRLRTENGDVYGYKYRQALRCRDLLLSKTYRRGKKLPYPEYIFKFSPSLKPTAAPAAAGRCALTSPWAPRKRKR